MEKWGNRDGHGPSRDSLSGKNVNLIRYLLNIVENQQKQIELLRQGLLIAPRKQRLGNVSYFRRLQPVIFSGIEKPLDAEQWLIDTIDLVTAAQILDQNQVEMANVQLRVVVRTRWLTEEARLEKPISWDQFLKCFYEKFFPTMAQKEMEEQFIRLQLWDQKVYEYATEFLRLSWFTPYMVVNEEKRASRF